LFADNDMDGLPDIIQNAQSVNLSGTTNIFADGKTYNSLDELPPEYRKRYEQAMSSIDKNLNGVPDFLEGMINVTPTTPDGSSNAGNYQRKSLKHSKRVPVQSVITPDTSGGWPLAIAGLLLLFLCAIGATGVWYFFLR
ncbi:MAG TPA: hypothetical protein DCX53_10800, partial [Anaerolineae bacterium]|nr:hypothetical protein [Anaerolineae bacterium]